MLDGAPPDYWGATLQRIAAEDRVPSVPWEPTPIDQMFLKSVGIKPE
jgi:hypothetical protein